ncbi:MAG: HAD-IC family P-type ATPase [Nitrospirota bacterium]|nr:HAD-IC family P-type ATPase [Nitrospirota bacterium]
MPGQGVLAALGREAGLSVQEAGQRQARYGLNRLPRRPLPGVTAIFLRQFRSPLIYILGVAAGISLAIGDLIDAGFIVAVLLINAVVGTFQEYSAGRSAEALQGLVPARATVLRDGEAEEVDAVGLVPGDVVLLASGTRVPADLRLLAGHDLRVDEALLTGESLPVDKFPDRVLAAETPVAERRNMAFSGTIVVSGRGRGVVVGTGMSTQIGGIASAMLTGPDAPPPLVLRMHRFTLRIGLLIGVATLAMGGAALARGLPLHDVFMMAVALAVGAIPEGLPVALTVALAVGMRRMATRNVVVRELVAVEALGSCTLIATDKTGTLTANDLTVHRIAFAMGPCWEVTGSGLDLEGGILPPPSEIPEAWSSALTRLCRAGLLCNEATLVHRDGHWRGRGDSVDVALLVLGRKDGLTEVELARNHPLLASIPFESERRFAATLHSDGDSVLACVKGAAEQVVPMCSTALRRDGEVPIDQAALFGRVEELAQDGFRVLALAEGVPTRSDPHDFAEAHLSGLVFLGLVGLIDPLRPEVRPALDACRHSGVKTVMITGDHPATALAIARDLGMAEYPEQVVTGVQLAEAEAVGEEALDALVARTPVFARVEPGQKLAIVVALGRQGHFVAVTGDGANDAPALRAAHVGVAMGRGGTDVAREASDLVVADDNFATIVAGVEEGRVAYNNVRKVVNLLIATGMGELVLFFLALLSGMPLPLLPAQLLWLNLVTNGIQDVALAFEPAEGDELNRPPRPPREPMFERVMRRRVVLTALVVGGVAWGLFRFLLDSGMLLDEARNVTLLLMVLFENVYALCCRSESRSVFFHNPLRNPLLLFGILAAQLIHIAALYIPLMQTVLRVQPVRLDLWLTLVGMSLLLLGAVEFDKWLGRGRSRPHQDGHVTGGNPT